MPFCQNCGRVLAENEVCNCTTANPNPTGTNFTNTPPPPMAQPIYNNVVNQQQPQKKSLWWIWLIILPIILVVLMILAILAAILVPSMIGYTNKAKLSSMNSSASSLYKAANSSIVELDEEGNKIHGYYIISSDEKKNFNIPSGFDTDEFYSKMDNFFSDNSKVEWFVVMEDSYVSYSANSENWDSKKLVGTYPAATTDGPTYYDATYSSNRSKASLNELYKDAKSKVDDKSSSASYDDYYTYY